MLFRSNAPVSQPHLDAARMVAAREQLANDTAHLAARWLVRFQYDRDGGAGVYLCGCGDRAGRVGRGGDGAGAGAGAGASASAAASASAGGM